MYFSKIIQTFNDLLVQEAILNGCIRDFFLQLIYSFRLIVMQFCHITIDLTVKLSDNDNQQILFLTKLASVYRTLPIVI